MGVIVERDSELLSWVARWRCVTSSQVGRWFGFDDSGVRIVDRRVSVWREHGLVKSSRILSEYPSVHSLTASGLEFLGLDTPVRWPIVGQLRHDLAVVDLAIWLRGQGESRMVTEREVQALDPVSISRPPKYAIAPVDGAARKILYPDLLTVRDGKGFGHEVELARKDSGRLSALMMSYGRASHVAGVTYYAPPARLRAVERVAAEANERMHSLWGVGAKVSVRGWEWTS